MTVTRHWLVLNSGYGIQHCRPEPWRKAQSWPQLLFKCSCWLKVGVWEQRLWNCFEKCFQCHLSFFFCFVFNYFLPLFFRFPELLESSHVAYSLLPLDLFVLQWVSMSLLLPPRYLFSDFFKSCPFFSRIWNQSLVSADQFPHYLYTSQARTKTIVLVQQVLNFTST